MTEASGCIISDHDQPCTVELKRPMICELHRNRLLGFLRDLPGHAVDVQASLGRSTTAQSERVSSSYEQPLPASVWLSVVDLSNDKPAHTFDPEMKATVLDTLDQWVRMVAEERIVRAPELTRSLEGLHHACTWLAGQVDWIAAQPWSEELYAEVQDAHRQVRTAAHAQPAPRRGLVPCGACGMRALVQADTGENYRCRTNLGGCGGEETEVQHEGRIMETDIAIQTTKRMRRAG